ncbi:MAG: hypothetical protein FIA97_15845 [Methylococcaceae bacterium]|nr:hypothetical protein [Methylococcaceae bacterium]
MIVLVIILSALAIAFKIDRIFGRKNWIAINTALDDYEEIIDGKLWIGRNAVALASERLDNPSESGPIRYEHICQMQSGAWFLFTVEVTQGIVISRSIRPCDETAVKARLQRHKDVYIRCFGQPTIA